MAANIVCFENTLKLFRIYQIFPPKGRELNPGLIFYAKFFLTCLLGSGLLVGSFTHFIHSLKSESHKTTFQDISYVLSMLTGYSFFVLFAMNTNSATKLFVFLSDFQEFGKPFNFDKRNQELEKLSKYHYIYISLASFSFLSVTNIFVPNECRKKNEEFDLREICGLVVNVWLPFNIDFFPAKEIYMILQVFSIFYVYVLAGTMSWFIAEMVEHFSVRVDHIKSLFVDALNQKDPSKMRNDFSFAIRYHSAFLELENDFNQCFSVAMFMIMLLGAAILGCATSGYLQARSSSLLVTCFAWFVALTIVCVSGQRLTDKNLTIAEAIYNARWYDALPTLRWDIVVVLMRCQRPMKLRAAAFGVMNHSMIVSVLRASYSYLSILRASS